MMVKMALVMTITMMIVIIMMMMMMFDEQTCVMKFGSWTYDGFQVKMMIVVMMVKVALVMAIEMIMIIMQVDLRHQDAAESQMRSNVRLKSESQSRVSDNHLSILLHQFTQSSIKLFKLSKEPENLAF